MLEEAAYELFLEQGYAGTTAADIARRAGVSRGTFFNYFQTKADVFWVDIDATIERLSHVLARQRTQAQQNAQDRGNRDPSARIVSSTYATIAESLREVAASLGPDRVPWLLTQFEAIGSPSEVRSAALDRFLEVATVLQRFIASSDGVAVDGVKARTVSYTVLGAVLAAAQSWAAAGQDRGDLAVHVSRAFATLGDTFR